jgi:hypothetical protein
MTSFRFRLFTRESVGASTSVRAASQAEALAHLQQQLAPWEFATPLHGPNRSLRSFI